MQDGNGIKCFYGGIGFVPTEAANRTSGVARANRRFLGKAEDDRLIGRNLGGLPIWWGLRFVS